MCINFKYLISTFEKNKIINASMMAEDWVIQFENSSIFQDDHLVLSEVNFSLAKNEFVYLIGRVGSGKSSLIKTINAELPLKTGTAMVVGANKENIVRKVNLLLHSQHLYNRMAEAKNPFGDGKAAKRIAKIVLEQFKKWVSLLM